MKPKSKTPSSNALLKKYVSLEISINDSICGAIRLLENDISNNYKGRYNYMEFYFDEPTTIIRLDEHKLFNHKYQQESEQIIAVGLIGTGHDSHPCIMKKGDRKLYFMDETLTTWIKVLKQLELMLMTSPRTNVE